MAVQLRRSGRARAHRADRPFPAARTPSRVGRAADGRVVRTRWPLAARPAAVDGRRPVPVPPARPACGGRERRGGPGRRRPRPDALRRASSPRTRCWPCAAGHSCRCSTRPPGPPTPPAPASTCTRSRCSPAGRAAGVVLSSPIILYDHPRIAPESPGDLFDAREIDEILTLRTLTLTDEEKREARATDPRAAAVIDRADAMPARGAGPAARRGAVATPAVRRPGRRRSPPPPRRAGRAPLRPPTPWWDPGADDRRRPGQDAVLIDGVRVRGAARVRLHPGPGGTDVHDMFLGAAPRASRPCCSTSTGHAPRGDRGRRPGRGPAPAGTAGTTTSPPTRSNPSAVCRE